MNHPRINYIIATVLIVVMIVLHQDWWFWNSKYLVLGFLPMGLAYHALYSLMAAATMFCLVRLVWPRHLEDTQPLDPARAREQGGGH